MAGDSQVPECHLVISLAASGVVIDGLRVAGCKAAFKRSGAGCRTGFRCQVANGSATGDHQVVSGGGGEGRETESIRWSFFSHLSHLPFSAMIQLPNMKKNVNEKK